MRASPSERRWINLPAGGAVLCLWLVLFASACGPSSPAANLPTPSAAPGTPAGGPVPAQLRGDWLMPAAAANSIAAGACPTPVAVATCMFRLTFTATTYNWTTNVAGFSGGGGDVVAKSAELDFFNGQECGLKPPEGVGRYSWTLTVGVLHFTSLAQDVCPRAPFLANQDYSRTG